MPTPRNPNVTQHRLATVLLICGVFVMLAGVASGAAAQSTTGDLYALPDRTARVAISNSIATTGNGQILVAANMLNDTAALVEPFQNRLQVELAVGRDPRTAAITPDSTRALVANRGDGTVSVIDIDSQTVTATHAVGSLPYGVVTADDNATAWVALQGTHEVIRLHIPTGEITARVRTPEFPSGMALWGDFLYVTHLWSGDFSLIYIPQLTVVRTISTGDDSALSQAVMIDPARALAYLPQTRLYAVNPELTYDSAVLPVVNVVDLRSMTLLRRERLALNIADRPVNMPFATVLDTQRRYLYVANAGSDNVSVVDLNSGLAVAHVRVNANPRGMLISRDNGVIYIHNMIAGTITVLNAVTLDTSTISISVPNTPADVLFGAELFHRASDSRVSQDSWISCASCHFDGLADGRTWRGFPGGLRNTPVLYDLQNTAPYNRSGTWDEIADVDYKIRGVMSGTGLIDGMLNPPMGEPHGGLSLDMDNLTSYIFTLNGPTAPPPADPTQIEQGAVVFAEQGCAACHAGDTYANSERHDVGTGGEFVTPTLRWLWLSAPYFHDGRADTLNDVFLLPGTHQIVPAVPPEDVNALVAFLLSLPASTPDAP